jgi:hypothetical protein
LPKFLLSLLYLRNIFGVNLACGVRSPCDLIDVIRHRREVTEQLFTVIIAEFHDNAHEDHSPDKIADILHSAVAEFGVDDLFLPLTDSDFEPFISFL